MPVVTKTRVEARVRDWIRRLNALYAKLDEWIPRDAAVQVRKEHLDQVIEPIMRQVNAASRKIPTYTVIAGKRRIAFVPSALWIVGANGRVDISTNERQHMLVDIGDETDGCSNWQLVLPDDRNNLKPFNREAFLSLLRESK